MADGKVVIDIEANSDKFDRQIMELEKKIEKEEDKKILIETKMDTQTTELEKAKQKTEEWANALKKVQDLKQVVARQGATPEQFTELQELTREYGTLEDINKELDKSISKQSKIAEQASKTKFNYDAISGKVNEYKQKIDGLRLQKHQKDLQEVKKSVDGVASSFGDAVKRAGKLALGIFGIRSAYIWLRQASSQLAQYDQQYATDLEYIKYVLVQIIAPTLKSIIRYVLLGLQYVNALLNGLFGVNLFTNASADAFNKMKKNASGVSKAVKEIKKDLLGFDEITRLTEDGAVAGATGVGMPSLDVSDLEAKPPKWLEYIVKNKDKILAIFAGITVGIVAISAGLGGIKALGIGALITGAIRAVQNLLKYLESPKWETFYKMIQDIGIGILGLGLIVNSVPVAIAGALTLILAYIGQHWQEIKKGFMAVIEWIKGLGQGLWNWFFSNIDKISKDWGALGVGIVAVFTYVFNWVVNIVAGIVEIVSNIMDGIYWGVKNIFDGIIMLFQGNFKNGIISILKGIVNAIIGILNGLISGINAILYPLRSLIAGLGQVFGKNWTVDTVKIPKIPYVKTGAIINMPNKGTMIGASAIGGESGREGVVPLTDQQAMAELGREIGKNVLVNLTNITSMNGRIISRELKQVQSEQDFAYNT